MKINRNFLGEGEGVVHLTKYLPWGEYGHFLELQNKIPRHFPDLEEFFSLTIS